MGRRVRKALSHAERVQHCLAKGEEDSNEAPVDVEVALWVEQQLLLESVKVDCTKPNHALDGLPSSLLILLRDLSGVALGLIVCHVKDLVV